MPTNTERLNLFKYDVEADANSTFNITKCLNDNWDKIDTNTAKLTDLDGVWTNKHLSLATLSKMTSSDVTFDLSKYLPNDGKVYEVLVSGNVQPTSTLNKYVNLYVKSDIIRDSNIGICGNRTASESAIAEGAGSAIIPIGTGRKLIRVGLSSTNAEGQYTLYAGGYRKVR